MNGDAPQPIVVLELSRTQRKELHAALLEAFPTSAALARMVDFELSENLAVITSGGGLGDVSYELIKWAQANGALGRLVNAARSANPGNPRLRLFEESIVRARNERPEDPTLRTFADQVSLAPGPAAPLQQIERIVHGSERFQNVDDWRGAQTRGELAVCMIEMAALRATGFLVGPDLLMTAQYTVESMIKGKRPWSDVTVRFDYREYGDGQTLSPGQPYTLSADPIVDSSPTEALDYAVLRVNGRPGSDPVGGQPGAPARGWLTPRAHVFRSGEVLFVIQHPRGGPLKFAHGPFVETLADSARFDPPHPTEPRILYEVPTEPGSGGAPVFSSDWELVGIHEGMRSSDNHELKRGIPMTPIVERLCEKGVL